LTQAYADDGLRVALVVSGHSSGGPATSEYCQAIANKYELATKVLCDPDDLFLEYGKNAQVVLIDTHGIVLFNKQNPTFSYLKNRIAEELGL
jgi:hypothetical protein